MDFSDYLQSRQLSPKSIETYQRYQHIFSHWLAEAGHQAEELTYTDLLGYVSYCKQRGLRQEYINQLLGVVRHYYNYLKYNGLILNNPASGLYIRGKRKRIPHDLYTAEQLEDLYRQFHQRGLVGKRNKLMLGLLIYQGLGCQELDLLAVVHLKLREGKIDIPGTLRSNRRTLKLESHQVLDLHEYISKTRMHLLAIREEERGVSDPTFRPSGVPGPTFRPSEKLFISTGSSETLHGSIDKLMKRLRARDAHFINAQQLRQSRLALWMKQYDIRQVQYMAGHKYVSSTERYESTHLEDLQKELAKHHPGSDQ